MLYDDYSLLYARPRVKHGRPLQRYGFSRNLTLAPSEVLSISSTPIQLPWRAFRWGMVMSASRRVGYDAIIAPKHNIPQTTDETRCMVTLVLSCGNVWK